MRDWPTGSRRGPPAGVPGPCVGYMAIGKFLRYLAYTTALVWFLPVLRPWLEQHGFHLPPAA
jgi:hypothetical protein